MRPLLLLLLSVTAAFSQRFSFGVRGGVPLTDLVDKVDSQNFTFNTTTNRYIVGPTVELHLIFGLGIEADALYRHMSYNGSGVLNSITSSSVNSGDWEFPLLAKYRFPSKIIRPFVDGGVAWDKLSGLTQSVKQSVATQTATVVHKDSSIGYVVGAGVDIHAFLHFSPEIRFTHWNSQQLVDPTGLVHSKQNQAEVLLGITF
jgi:opacity protein-like surface antigen